jgi:hypothetical protein
LAKAAGLKRKGDDIYLENTKADFVRGNHVKISPGYEIGIVEYSGTYEYKSESVVKANKKSNSVDFHNIRAVFISGLLVIKTQK